ncbi:response regulator transcription factor [Acinetobacter soli]|uniref:response regulator transcription factor n=1 Tax=Acinetobacter soli TaxID=487316 RepID=UPI0032184698
MRILVIEDDIDILNNISEYLQLNGYLVDSASDGLQAMNLVDQYRQHYDLLLIDLNLPRLDGLQLIKNIKKIISTLPIIVITARDQLDDKLNGFAMGIDDYLIKPFALAELNARIQAVWNRCYNLGGQSLLQVEDLILNRERRELSRAGQVLKLSPIALILLEILMLGSPNVVVRQKLEQQLWQDSPPDSDSLRTHIHHIRQVIDKPFAKPLLHTVHSVGYRLSK